jgi:hypothetical protein
VESEFYFLPLLLLLKKIRPAGQRFFSVCHPRDWAVCLGLDWDDDRWLLEGMPSTWAGRPICIYKEKKTNNKTKN